MIELQAYVQEMFELARTGDKQGVIFFIGLYTFLVCSYSLIFQIRINGWSETIGSMAKEGVAKFGPNDIIRSHQDYRYKALYQYRVDGKEYQGSRVSPWVMIASHNARSVFALYKNSIHRHPGNKVSIYYNPKNPKKSYLIKTGIKSQAFTMMIALAPFVFYWFEYYG